MYVMLRRISKQTSNKVNNFTFSRELRDATDNNCTAVTHERTLNTKYYIFSQGRR